MTKFKFKYIDEDGDPQGFFYKKGHFDKAVLVLKDDTLPVTAIGNLEVRKNVMVISVLNQHDQVDHITLQVSGISAEKLKCVIDLARSGAWAAEEKVELESKGLGHLYRDTECRHCSATISLSRLPVTPQLYCNFCDTLTTIDNRVNTPKDEKDCKLCDDCGMFSKTRKFTIFYFYFLIFFYGFTSRPTWRCAGCMRGDAWKMFFGNLIFILGVPTAIIQLVRSYTGSVTGAFAGLDKANLMNRKGKTKDAFKIYQNISKNVPVSAGIKYNIALNLIDTAPDLALDSLELAYADCSNYPPVFNALCHCYTEQQHSDKLNEIKEQWGVSDGPPSLAQEL
ncbi:MAG: hypothetical protein ACI9FG_001068 [Crocinitomicaceae bacterium]|jgi:hypothetical protein